MKASKDNFSKQADSYSKYRPGYPLAVYEHILAQTEGRKMALDCATGNGQAARELARYFAQVKGIDISTAQLQLAHKSPNIEYLESRAEQTPFEDDTFDLITVAQAFHWFDHPAFFKEVKRVGKPGAILAVWGYDIGRVSEEIDRHFDHFYQVITGPYWDDERRHVDARYQSIPFELEELPTQQFVMDLLLTLNQFAGYLYSWSGVQHMIRAGQPDPIPALMNLLKHSWSPDEEKVYRIPIFLRLGRV